MNIILAKFYSGITGKGLGAPLSLLYLSAALKKAGFTQVKVIDFTFSNDVKRDIVNLIKEEKPKVFGVTVNSHDRFGIFDMIRLIKKTDSSIVTVMGGPHATLCNRDIIEDLSELDVLVVGDGESTLVEIVQTIKKRKSLSEVKGIYFRDSNGRIKVTEPRQPKMNLDFYPFPDRDALDLERYTLFVPIEGRPRAISLISSRGCPFHCNFCAAKEIGGGIIRFRSVDNIVQEVKMLIERFPNYHLFFYDDHFLLDKKRVIEFCSRVKEENLNFKWGCYGRVDSIDEEVTREIARIGCEMVSFGVESGSDYVLDLMNKKINLKKIKQAIFLVKKYGIVARCSVIFNYPGERLRDIFRTFWMLWRADIEPDKIAIAENTIIYPATEVFNQLKDKYLPKDFSWSKKYPDLPHYKDVPIYIPPFNFFRVRLVHTIRRFYTLFYKIKSLCRTFVK